MLRYIYFLCLLMDLELVFCYNSIRRNDRSHRIVARVRRRQEYGSEDSPLANVDLVNFMQKPDDPEDLSEPYNFDNKEQESEDEHYLMSDDATPRMRRSRHGFPAHEAAQPPRQMPSGHIARHPRKKCSFSFPFFSHKNKTKPAGSKHKKRKAHSFQFYKRKHITTSLPVATSGEQHTISGLELHINAAPETIAAGKKRMSSNVDIKPKRAKKNLPNIIHNSRQYFANHLSTNSSGWMTGAGANNARDDDKQKGTVHYEDNIRRVKSIDEQLADNAEAEESFPKDLAALQREQKKILQKLENRLRESYNILRNLHI